MSQYLEPNSTATHSMIWMHGLGASYQDMKGLAEAMALSDLSLRHVFLQAPNRSVTINQGFNMPAWYDIVGDSLTEREDEAGILASEQQIIDAIASEMKQGIPSSRIFLAGFSQGGAMALHTALKYPEYLAGVVALSCYLPLADKFQLNQRKTLPIFMAYGDKDPIVWPAWSLQTEQKLRAEGLSRISTYSYPMMHEVSLAEIQDLRGWILQRVPG